MKKYIHVTRAEYVHDQVLKITFSDGHQSVVDFKDAMDYYCKGYYEKYKKPSLFRKFMIDEGKLVWGKDWDVVFDEYSLYKGHIDVPVKHDADDEVKDFNRRIRRRTKAA